VKTRVKQGMLAGAVVTAAAALVFAVPAISAPGDGNAMRMGGKTGFGTFTPAAADPRLAASLARSGMTANQLRFTPVAAIGRNRAVTVAVRARTMTGASQTAAIAAPSATLGVAPVAYDLGVGVGWKRFALTGDVRRVDTAMAPGSREQADVGISYNARKWSTRVQVAADRPAGNVPRTIVGGDSMSLDVGGAYKLTRNLDVTAGVRYRSERNRLDRIEDERRDSQAVYVGTAFRF
jgi:hypothetical protein